ncbi:alpha/beta-hydrolase [Xylariaceae sp. FL1651]|nr:alpha/beta-hydrolase [Xylariaceae sp. FL1651]
MPMVNTPSTDFFHFEYVRILGMAPMHGSDVAECLEAAMKIQHNDPESWFRAWSEAADTSEALAEEAVAAGDTESARWAYLRSSNYRRASEFMLHVSPSDPRLMPIIEKSVGHFRKACALFDSPVEYLEVPYQGYQLPAYLYMPNRRAGIDKKVPIVINTGGFDSTQEELYYLAPAGARTRGYACLTFDGPGQGTALRRDHLVMRADWEVVISAVLDKLFQWAKENPDWNLDLTKIALVGASMGGYFALRGATDPRITACVCSDGFYDFGLVVRQRTPWFWKFLSDDVADYLLGLVGQVNFQSRLEFGHSRLTFGTDSPSAALRRMQTYTLEPEGQDPILPKIKCPTLIHHGRDSLYGPLESQRIYDGLTSLTEGVTKKLWDPETLGQGSLQAKMAAISHYHLKTFSWLDDVFGIKREDISGIFQK